MSDARYRLSFTTGGLLLREAAIAAPLYCTLGDWAQVRATIDSENLLQARTVSSGKRVGREVVQRLAELTDLEIDLLVEATATERGHLMWTAACRRYVFLADFAEEVLRERFLVLASELHHAEFDSFVRTKALWHQELAELRESTYRKLRSNIFLMLRELGVLDEAGKIVASVLTDRVAKVLSARVTNDVRFFPAYESVARVGGL